MLNEKDLFRKLTGRKRKLSEMQGEESFEAPIIATPELPALPEVPRFEMPEGPALPAASSSNGSKEAKEQAETLRFAELFAGIGGGRVALEWGLGLKHIFSSEIDNTACDFYKLNFGEKPKGDITKIDKNKIPDFDFLVAGFPCQPFSISGNQKGLDDKKNGNLFFQITKTLKAKQPALFLLENVEQIEKNKKGCLDIIKKALDEAGYTIKTAVLNSCNFGTPQHRQRWYCVGIRKDLDPKNTFEQYFQFPEQFGEPKNMLLDVIEDTALPLTEQLEYNPETLKNILPYMINKTKAKFQKIINSYKANPSERGVNRFATQLREVVKIPAKFFKNGKLASNGMVAHWTDSGAFRPSKGKMANDGTEQSGSFATYNARSLSNHASTLTTVGHANNILELGRRLSGREQARLQTFPDHYKVVEDISTHALDSCFGNAFTVNVIQAIAQNMIEHYHKLKAQISFDDQLPAAASYKQKYGYEGRGDKSQGFKQMATVFDTFDLLDRQCRSIKKLRTVGPLPLDPDPEISDSDLSDSDYESAPKRQRLYKTPNLSEQPSAFKAVIPKKQIRSIKENYSKMMEYYKNNIESGTKKGSHSSQSSNSNSSHSNSSNSNSAMETQADKAQHPLAGKRITFKFDHGKISFKDGAVVENTLRDLASKRGKIIVLCEDSLKGSPKMRI